MGGIDGRLGLAIVISVVTAAPIRADVNSGSDGHDGALNPTSNLVIDMHDHPDGIYQYTSVNIPPGVTVSFIPNTANTPVVWLVQTSCTIAGTIDLRGKFPSGVNGGAGGPGGYRGGNGAPGTAESAEPGPGLGPGGGKTTPSRPSLWGGNGSYATVGYEDPNHGPAGGIYGSPILIPLIGGSGGAGNGRSAPDSPSVGGGGGGGAILIAASGLLSLSGYIGAYGAHGSALYNGVGSGGAVRLVSTALSGNGSICTHAGWGDGIGRIRIEAESNTYTGGLWGSASLGFPGIILPPANENPSLAITSLGGISVPPGAVGSGATVDVIIPGGQANPMTVGVGCHNIPLNSDIVVEVRPLSGAIVSAAGQNTSGTQASSTATVSLNLPPGEGYISARTTINLGLSSATKDRKAGKRPSLAETGLAANGERFKKVEIASALGGSQELVYVTESGKRFPMTGSGRPAMRKAVVSTRPS